MSLQIVSWNDLNAGERLSNSRYGDIYRGIWNGKDIVIKRLKEDSRKEEIQNEAKMMFACQSERVVRLLVLCEEVGHCALAMEFMEKGSLFQLLQDSKVHLPWSLRYRLALDIGEGLAYVHEKKILHCDLKSRNILLDEQLRAKISDLSRARIEGETGPKAAPEASLRWQAPELFKADLPTKASDVYSYGMILFEIAARKMPFSKAKEETTAIQWISQGTQETLPPDCPELFGLVAKSCWSINPQNRPTGAEAVERVIQAMQAAQEPMFQALEAHDFSTLGELLVRENPALKVETLIEKFNKDGWGEIQLAIILGRLDKLQDLCTPHILNVKSRGESLLDIAAGWRAPLYVMHWLIEQNPKLLDGDMFGWTPLHAAAYAGYLDALKLLVRWDRSLLQKSTHGDWTALHEAVRGGHLDAVQWLGTQEPSHLSLCDEYGGRTPLHLAADQGFLEIVKWLVGKDRSPLIAADREGWIPLHSAAMNGHLSIVKWFIEEDSELLGIKDRREMTAEDLARQSKKTDVVDWLVQTKIKK